MIINDGYVFVLFDLPTETKEHRRKYSKFRSQILKSGYLMFQKSIYYKYLRDIKNIEQERIQISNIPLDEGNIRMFKMTKKQFDSILTLKGEKIINNDHLDYIEY